jgi:hypothetical protein
MRTTIGWGLLIAGVGVQIAQAMAQADASLNNTTLDTTTFGQVVGPINAKLPSSLGLLLAGAGAMTLWVLPLVGVK